RGWSTRIRAAPRSALPIAGIPQRHPQGRRELGKRVSLGGPWPPGDCAAFLSSRPRGVLRLAARLPAGGVRPCVLFVLPGGASAAVVTADIAPPVLWRCESS